MLEALRMRLDGELPGIELHGQALEAATEIRYGKITVVLDYDAEVQSIRVTVRVPPPIGGGAGFLIWCLCANVEYWDVKLGMDDEGMLCVLADLDASEAAGPEPLSRFILDRIGTIVSLLDDDLIPYLIEHGLGTMAQRKRWASVRVSAESGATPES